MTELSFNAELYAESAVDAAVEAYGDYATLELEKREGAYVVRLKGSGEFDEAAVADELGNYALGATIEARAANL